MTVEEVHTAIRKLLEIECAQLGPPRNSPSLKAALDNEYERFGLFSGATVDLEWERGGWGNSVRLGISMPRNHEDVVAKKGLRAALYEVSVNNSASRKTPANARAFAVLVSKVADIACMVEAFLEEVDFVVKKEERKRS